MNNPNSDPIPQKRSLKDIYDYPAEQLLDLTKDEVIGVVQERVVSWGDPLPAEGGDLASSAGIPVNELTVGDYVLFGMLARGVANAPTTWEVNVGGGIVDRGVDFYRLVDLETSVGGLFHEFIPPNRDINKKGPQRLNVRDDSHCFVLTLGPGRKDNGKNPDRYYLTARPKPYILPEEKAEVERLNSLFVTLGLDIEEEQVGYGVTS